MGMSDCAKVIGVFLLAITLIIVMLEKETEKDNKILRSKVGSKKSQYVLKS